MDIQFTSDDGSVAPGHTMYDWSQIFINAGEQMGRTFMIAKRSKQLIEEAGFVDVVEKRYKMPVGGWMEDETWKQIGLWNLLYLMTGLEGMQLYILKNVLGVGCFPLFLPPQSEEGEFVVSKEEKMCREYRQLNYANGNSGITPKSKPCREK